MRDIALPRGNKYPSELEHYEALPASRDSRAIYPSVTVDPCWGCFVRQKHGGFKDQISSWLQLALKFPELQNGANFANLSTAGEAFIRLLSMISGTDEDMR